RLARTGGQHDHPRTASKLPGEARRLLVRPERDRLPGLGAPQYGLHLIRELDLVTAQRSDDFDIPKRRRAPQRHPWVPQQARYEVEVSVRGLDEYQGSVIEQQAHDGPAFPFGQGAI